MTSAHSSPPHASKSEVNVLIFFLVFLSMYLKFVLVLWETQPSNSDYLEDRIR